MQTELQISYQNMDPSRIIEERVREKAARLEHYFDRIIGCRVVIEAPHRRRTGGLYNVRIEISVPGKNIHVGRAGPRNHAHEDVTVAIRDAFDAARRLLEDHARRMRGDVKTHEAPLHGTVRRLFEDHGFVEMPDGQEVYFHRNSVVGNGSADLAVGGEVRLVIAEKEGVEGPQASTIMPIGKHHIVE